MAYQRVPQTAEIRVVFDFNGQPCMNTYHAEMPVGYDQTALDGLASTIDAGAGSGILTDLAAHVQYLRTDVVGLDQENDLTATANANAGWGLKTANVLTANVAFVVSKLSGLTGRNARGRVFITGIPIIAMQFSGAVDNLLYDAYRDAYVAHVDGIRSGIEGIGLWNAVIVSRWHNSVKRTEGKTFPWTSTVANSNKVGTQRRRLGR